MSFIVDLYKILINCKDYSFNVQMSGAAPNIAG